MSDEINGTGEGTGTGPTGGESGPAPGSSVPWWTSQPDPGAGAGDVQPGPAGTQAPHSGWTAGPSAGPWYGPGGMPGSQPPPWGGSWGWAPPPGGYGPQPGHPGSSGQAKGRRVLAGVAAGILTAGVVLGGVGIGYAVWSPSAQATPTAKSSTLPTTRYRTDTTGPTEKTSNATGGPTDIATIATKVDPSLVDIDTVLGDETGEAAGTGMVLTSTGKVLTNNHVIEGSTSISVTDLGNGETYQASVLGYDRTQDIAVIQLKGASGLKTAAFGNSSTVKVGDAVVGIGNAGGTGGTPSTAGGEVTALDQAITASDAGSGTSEHLTGLIESNCDIEPGDSGGPLVDSAGKIVGMDTAASASEGFSFQGADTGQGYSIPINTAVSIAKEIEAAKAVTGVHLGETPFLGVGVSAASNGSSSQQTPFGHLGFGFRTPTVTPRTFGATTTTQPGTTGTTRTASSAGVYVTEVISGSAAQKAGIVKGDVITSVGGTTVSSPNDLTKVIEKYKPGTTVAVTWTDTSGQSQSATATFTSGPAG